MTNLRFMTKAEQYRLRAKKAEEQASKIHDTQLKEGFSEIARQWRALAEQVERYGLT
jgi:hypothetical protein